MLDDLVLPELKTRALVKTLINIGASGKVLFSHSGRVGWYYSCR